MDVSFLEPVFRAAGPYATVCADVTHTTENADTELDLRVRAVGEQDEVEEVLALRRQQRGIERPGIEPPHVVGHQSLQEVARPGPRDAQHRAVVRLPAGRGSVRIHAPEIASARPGAMADAAAARPERESPVTGVHQITTRGPRMRALCSRASIPLSH